MIEKRLHYLIILLEHMKINKKLIQKHKQQLWPEYKDKMAACEKSNSSLPASLVCHFYYFFCIDVPADYTTHCHIQISVQFYLNIIAN